MEFYETYFVTGKKETAYASEQEAMEDIRAFVDLCIYLAFRGRNIAEERLDMRGVVITPQEVEQALLDGTLEYRSRRETAIRAEILAARRHLESRREESRKAEKLPRVYHASEHAGADEREEFCFWLALVLEYDRKYERLYGYLQDNVGARLPTVGLGISLYSMWGQEREPWIGAGSRLWQYLLKDSTPEAGESRLSRPMSVRDSVIEYLQQEQKMMMSDPAPGAVKIYPVYTWEDLVAEESQQRLLRQICDRVRYRDTVMEKWGFAGKSPYGNGISAVFYGAPGTGKTMAAQIIGNEIGQEICKVDLSRMVSKYIGETEKNIKTLFDHAAKYQEILFFDEADSLFARRTEVSGSNDRYANMETGYLLQQFEEFEGITILATNFIHNIDEAFRRRIKYYVRFPFPDREMRLRLWNNMIPSRAPVEDSLRTSELAEEFELSGSDIKEVVTSAAYLAASAGHGIRRTDIDRALEIHYLKLGKKINMVEKGR